MHADVRRHFPGPPKMHFASGRRARPYESPAVNLRLAFLAKASLTANRDMFSHERDSGGNHRPPVLGLPRPLKQERRSYLPGCNKVPAGLRSGTANTKRKAPGDLSANVSCRLIHGVKSATHR